jgi:hypothetical protein
MVTMTVVRAGMRSLRKTGDAGGPKMVAQRDPRSLKLPTEQLATRAKAKLV